MTQEDYRKLPKVVQQLCELFDCMIIGSTVEGKVSDIDLVVPLQQWQNCASFLVAFRRTSFQLDLVVGVGEMQRLIG